MRWKSYFSWNDFFINLYRLVCEKGRIAGGHFEHKNSKSPPVNSFIISLWENDFRSKVLRCPTQCPRATFHTLSKSKVCNLVLAKKWNQLVNSECWTLSNRTGGHKSQRAMTYFQVALAIDQQIFWLQISINQIEIMEIFEDKDYLGRIKTRMRFTDTENTQSSY